MDLQLDGKRALITGSSSGIGEAIAKGLATEGVRVVVHGRREPEVRRVVAEIVANDGVAEASIGDLGTDAGAENVARAARAAFGGIDILVNNAGSFPLRGWWDTSPAQWIELFNSNLVSMVRMIRLLVPAMKLQKWGRVIQISSAAGSELPSGMADYGVSKAASIALTVSLAKELSGTGITVNTVSPGSIVTPGWRALATDLGKLMGWNVEDLETLQRLMEEGPMKTPVGRLGTPPEVAALVTFVASPLAGNIDGANLRVDGGQVKTIN
jgi:3-oxoacyl-[acyl-carrier protein] reductase